MFQFATKFAPEREKILRARDAGFSCGEIWLNGSYLEQYEEILGATEGIDFRYVLHFPNNELLPEGHLRNFVQLYHELDCGVAVIHKPMLRSYGRRLASFGGSSLILSVENGRQRGRDFETWAEDHEHLTLDVEHLWKFTLRDSPLEELEEALEVFLARFGSKVRHVHVPGYRPGSREHRPAYIHPEFARIVWDRLRDFGYEGFAVSETDLEYQTDIHLRRDIILFDRWFEEVEEPSPA